MKSMLVVVAAAGMFAVGTVGCGDDTGGGGGSGGGGDTSSTTGSGTGTGTTGSEATTGGGSVTSCGDLCALEPTATSSQKDCVAAFVAEKHPSVLALTECAAISSPGECDACYAAGSVTDDTCVGAHGDCF